MSVGCIATAVTRSPLTSWPVRALRSGVTASVTTLRKARTGQEVKGERVTAVAMHPTDIEALDLLREDGATGGFLLDAGAYERIFGPGVRGVPSVAVPCLLYTSPSPRDGLLYRMPSSACKKKQK